MVGEMMVVMLHIHRQNMLLLAAVELVLLVVMLLDRELLEMVVLDYRQI